MDSKYNFQQLEKKMSLLWKKTESFNPDSYPENKKTGKPFVIIMPPPNANDPLHIGHAMFITIEDILIRYHRMKGEDTLWLPGTDHAGIETQFVFEKKLRKKGQSRFNFDREKLFKMIWDYVQDNSSLAIQQMKQLGASADWSRFKFMLDKKIVTIVTNTFKKLHEDGLIYRDMKLVNYCTRCGTSYSELEVNHLEKTDPLYTIQYGPLKVSTVRPETIFGDIALAVHPSDKRYKNFIGQVIIADFPWGKIKVPVLADEYVKTDFGTGVLKITPYHDHNDYEIWKRHSKKLPQPTQIINNFGKLINSPKKYNGLGIVNARKEVVNDLKTTGLLLQSTATPHSVGVCYRCSRIIEPLPLPQFFIKVEPLVKPILKAIKNKEIIIHGAGHDKILKHWLKNLRDWNISRQIVWGIRIPIWYSIKENPKLQVTFLDNQGNTISGVISELLNREYSLEQIKKGLQSLNAPTTSKYIVSSTPPGNEYLQESDTFDTWFSSAQWPFSTLQSTLPGDFSRFYPTQVMETAYDILPFWVMRMLMIGNFITKMLPFKNIYFHGLIRDQKGQKMSKSKGNVVNPLEITEKYGTDALRMALVIRSSAGLDKSVGNSDFKAMRNFSNKIWNAGRYVLNMPPNKTGDPLLNQEFLTELARVIKTVSKQIDNFKIGMAADTVYSKFWHWYCDQIIEDSKNNKISSKTMLKGLEVFLALLHPFMPFVTEAIWQEKNMKKIKPLIASPWPSIVK